MIIWNELNINTKRSDKCEKKLIKEYNRFGLPHVCSLPTCTATFKRNTMDASAWDNNITHVILRENPKLAKVFDHTHSCLWIRRKKNSCMCVCKLKHMKKKQNTLGIGIQFYLPFLVILSKSNMKNLAKSVTNTECRCNIIAVSIQKYVKLWTYFYWESFSVSWFFFTRRQSEYNSARILVKLIIVVIVR